MARRRLSGLGRCAALLLGLVVLFQACFLLYFRDFYGSAQRAFWVPGLSEDFVPQGMERLRGGFLLSGYLSGSGAARLYWMEANGVNRAIALRAEGGGKLISHAGGVAVGGAFTYVAGGSGLCYVLSTADLLDRTQHTVDVLGSFRTGNRSSFCCIRDGMLLVGEYAYNQRFRTAESHHLTTPAGDCNTALVTAFALAEDRPLGVADRPAAAFSIPERIQGMSFSADGRAILSASSAFGASQLYLYDFQAVLEGRRGVAWVEDVPVPLYYVDSASGTEILHLPPKAEETVFSEGKLYLLFESASRRFQYGKLVGGSYVYSMSLPRATA